MIFHNFIAKYKNQGLIKEEKINLKGIENLIARAYKEITIAEANISINEGIYTSMLHAGRTSNG